MLKFQGFRLNFGLIFALKHTIKTYKMRFFKLVVFLLFISSAGYSQSEVEYSANPELASISKSIKLFPNPTTDFLHVRFDHVKAENVTIVVHNVIGNEMKLEVEVIDQHEVQVKVKDLAAGYYLLAIRDDETKFRGTYKFLKR